jgi:hypothetical protein
MFGIGIAKDGIRLQGVCQKKVGRRDVGTIIASPEGLFVA